VSDPDGSGVVFNHVGLCVSDLNRSRRFYEEALGFGFWWQYEVGGDPVARLLLLEPPVSLTAAYLVRDGLVLELLHYPGRTAATARRAMDEPGLTHLSLAVEDRSAVLHAVARLGGSVEEGTDVGAAVMVRDPDGQLIELTDRAWRSKLPPLPGR
jgi:catechol 2,3-dioxygenase-like lactoylglutathione lyase family enzyme